MYDQTTKSKPNPIDCIKPVKGVGLWYCAECGVYHQANGPDVSARAANTP